MTASDLRKKRDGISNNLQNTIDKVAIEEAEAERVEKIVRNTREILDDLDEEFRIRTGLTATDTVFMFLAIGLQMARQYIMTNDKFRFANHNQGDTLMKNALSSAPPEWKDILLQSVPYDAVSRGEHVNQSTGLSGATHRYRTLGHDPILGWIFGTANIMTNSLTKTDLETYQVSQMKIIRRYPLGVMGMLEKAIAYGTDEPMLLVAAVARQAIHFGSDYFTKQGLPIPLVSTVSDDLARKMMTQFHIDMYSFSRSALVATFINNLIYVMHQLFNDGQTEMDRKLYEVRTRKILSYSNLVASSTNVAVVAITQNYKALDAGGIAVSIHRLITDAKFIREVKREFVFGSYRNMIMGEDEKRESSSGSPVREIQGGVS